MIVLTLRQNNPSRNILLACLLAALSVVFSFSPTPADADWSPLIERLVAHGFEEGAVRTLFSRPEVKFEPRAMKSKLEELFKKKTVKPTGVLSGFLRSEVIADARSYVQENRVILEKIHTNYCVPQEIVVAILLIETLLGKNVGENFAFNRLASMALCTNLETIRPYLPRKLLTTKNEDLARSRCRQKADWAYAELKALIDYSANSGIDPVNIPGSIFGAIGLCQFMPSNIFSYGIDADGDGRIDLFSTPDALHSIANYLRSHGWKCNMNQINKKRVIFAYNHSTVYVNTVLAVAEKLKE
ncbi:MAG: lytic murein transglycosylase [Thermodesulfobacteriota bacterium]|nr:lytic murein transglycosylase [Thermodesulfobacteriota bacterium]